MNLKHVAGENRGKVMLYALSTCGWCKKTKQLLDELGVAHKYKYVDMSFGAEREELLEEVRAWNPGCSFPTIVIGELAIVGYKPDKIKETLGYERRADPARRNRQAVREAKARGGRFRIPTEP